MTQPGTYLSDIIQLLFYTNIYQVVVVGTSFGGLLALTLGVFMLLTFAGMVLNDAGPEIEPSKLDDVFDYICIDRPQPDWKSAAEAINIQMLGSVFQTESMVHNTYRDDGLLHFDWYANIAKPIIGTPGTNSNLWTYLLGLYPISLLVFRGVVSDVFSKECFLRMS